MTEPEANKRNRRQARENTRDQVVIGFVLKLIHYWLNKWCKLFLLLFSNQSYVP